MISIKDNKIRWAISAILALLILFGTYRSFFSLAAFLICGLLLVFCDKETNLLQMFFLMPMSSIFKFSPETQSFFTIVMLIYVVLHLVLPRKATLVVILFALYLFLGQLFAGSFNLFRTIKLICNLLFLSCTLNGKVKISHKEIFFSYIVGNIVASVMAKMDSGFFKIHDFVTMKELGGESFKDIIRFSGLYSDPNYYSVALIVSLCLLIVLFYRNEITFKLMLAFSAVLIYFLIITYSKSAFIMLVVPLFFLEYTFCNKKQYHFVLLSIFILLAVTALVMSGQISALDVIIERMTEMDSENFDISQATTGRFDLWLMYARFLAKNIKAALFGLGISSPLLNGAAAHNSYFDILYYLGVIGSGLLITTLVTISSQGFKKIRRCFLNYSVLLCIVVMYFFLSELFYFDPPYHFFLAFVVLNLPLCNRSALPPRIESKEKM